VSLLFALKYSVGVSAEMAKGVEIWRMMEESLADMQKTEKNRQNRDQCPRIIGHEADAKYCILW